MQDKPDLSKDRDLYSWRRGQGEPSWQGGDWAEMTECEGARPLTDGQTQGRAVRRLTLAAAVAVAVKPVTSLSSPGLSYSTETGN